MRSSLVSTLLGHNAIMSCTAVLIGFVSLVICWERPGKRESLGRFSGVSVTSFFAS